MIKEERISTDISNKINIYRLKKIKINDNTEDKRRE